MAAFRFSFACFSSKVRLSFVGEMNYLIYPDKMRLKLVRRQKLIYVEKPQFATSGDYSQPRTSFPRHVFLATVTCWSLLKGKYLLKEEGAQNRVVAYLIEWITVLVAEKDHVINESLQHALRSQNYRKVHGGGEGRGSFFLLLFKCLI